jgi:transcriptional regulator NrdR family protein
VSTKSPPVYFLGLETCLNCRDTVFAAEEADLEADCIRYRWTCDLCGHRFTTEAKLISDKAA